MEGSFLQYNSIQELFQPMVDSLRKGSVVKCPVTLRERDHILWLSSASVTEVPKMGLLYVQEMIINYLMYRGICLDLVVATVALPSTLIAAADYFTKLPGDANFADGRIDVITNHDTPIGEHLVCEEEGGRYLCTWVHLGQNYFKLIEKVCV